MKRIRLKSRTVPQCNCYEHYLELLHSIDGDTFVWDRYCYKCGKHWRYADVKQTPKFEDTYVLPLPSITVEGDIITFDDGRSCRQTYALSKEGWLGDFLRAELY